MASSFIVNHLQFFMHSQMLIGVDIHISTGGYVCFISLNPISWPSIKQRSVSLFSTEAEYLAVANSAAEVCWMLNPLQELHVQPQSQPTIYCDNAGGTYCCANPICH